MADQIVVEYTARIDKLQSQLKAAETSMTHLQDEAKTTATVITKQGDKAASGVQKVTKSTHGLRDAFSTLSGNLPFAGAIQQVTQLGGSLTGAVVGVEAMGTAWTALDLIFKRSIIGLIITAVVTLITAVTTFFRVSEEGGDKLAKIMSVLGVVVDKVTGLFVALGRAVVGAFEFGFEKAVEFYDFMVDTFLGGLDQMATALRSIGFDETAKKIDGATNSIKKARAESEKAAKDLVALGEAIADLQDKIGANAIDAQIKLAKLDNAINSNTAALRNRSHTYAESLKVIEQIEKAEQDKFNISTNAINEEIRLEGLKFKAKSENQLKGSIEFAAFINGQITALELLDRVSGSNTEEDVKRIGDLLTKRINAEGELTTMAERNAARRATFLIRETKQVEKKVEETKKVETKAEKDHTKDLEAELEKRNKAREASNKEAADMIKELNGIFERTEEEITKKQKEEAEKRKAIREATLNESIEIASNLLNGINDLELARANAEIDRERTANQKKTDEQTANLERQKEAGLISERQFAVEKQRIADQAAKKESALKRKQYEADKKASINRVLIETAVAVAKAVAASPLTFGLPFSAFAVANGALQIALINAQPTPQFKDGVIDLQGPGTGTSDSIGARLSKGESVMTAQETKEYKPLFKSIRDGEFDKYMDANFVRPALKKERERQRKQEMRAENMEGFIKSMQLNGMLDTSHLERLTKKNKSVKIENMNEFVHGIEKVMKPKSNRGL